MARASGTTTSTSLTSPVSPRMTGRSPGPSPRTGPNAAADPTTRIIHRNRRRAVPAIDTHDHLWPFERLPGLMETDRGRGMTLFGLWQSSYYLQVGALTARQPGEAFDPWWARARHDFDNSRATGFYRYQLPAFRDLYGVDFDRITDGQAKALDAKIFENYRDDRWVRQVITERANIELMLNDPYWARLDFRTHYPFEVLVFNVTTLLDGFHSSEFKQPADDPYHFARSQGLATRTLD